MKSVIPLRYLKIKSFYYQKQVDIHILISKTGTICVIPCDDTVNSNDMMAHVREGLLVIVKSNSP